MALVVPLSRFTSRVGGGSAFFVRPLRAMTKPKPKFQLIGDYPITEYKCGARAGESVRLRRDIVTVDHKGNPTGVVHHKDEIWTVLSGSVEPPVVVWLKQPDGKRHTWSDDDDFWITFERPVA